MSEIFASVTPKLFISPNLYRFLENDSCKFYKPLYTIKTTTFLNFHIKIGEKYELTFQFCLCQFALLLNTIQTESKHAIQNLI